MVVAQWGEKKVVNCWERRKRVANVGGVGKGMMECKFWRFFCDANHFHFALSTPTGEEGIKIDARLFTAAEHVLILLLKCSPQHHHGQASQEPPENLPLYHHLLLPPGLCHGPIGVCNEWILYHPLSL